MTNPESAGADRAALLELPAERRRAFLAQQAETALEAYAPGRPEMEWADGFVDEDVLDVVRHLARSS